MTNSLTTARNMGRRHYDRGMSMRPYGKTEAEHNAYREGYLRAWAEFLAENPDRATVATPQSILNAAHQIRTAS